MPRYYIDIRSHFGIDEDPVGLVLPDVNAARAEALKVVCKLIDIWDGRQPDYSTEIAIEIVGEDLRMVLAIPYSEMKLHLDE